MRKDILRATCLIAGLAISSIANAGFGLSDGFLPSSNPNSNTYWTAGGIGATGAANTFTAFTNTTAVGAINVLTGPGSLPAALYNTSNSPVTNGSATFAPFETALHPASAGVYGDFRFTAPTTGTYNISGNFHSIDTGIATPGTDGVEVLVRVNSLDLSTGTFVLGPGTFITTYGQLQTFVATLSLTAGQTIDFLVNGRTNLSYDATGVTANVSLISAAPEPASLSIALMGIVGLGAWRFRRTSKNQASIV